jgi:hypothetical protein
MNLRSGTGGSILGRWGDARWPRLSRCPERAEQPAGSATKWTARSVRDAARAVTRCDKRNYRTSARGNGPWGRNDRNNPAEHTGSPRFFENGPPADRPRLASLRAPRLARPRAAQQPAADGVSPVRDDAPCPAPYSGTAGRPGKQPSAAPRQSTPDCSNGSAERPAETGARTPSANNDGSESRADACLSRKCG